MGVSHTQLTHMIPRLDYSVGISTLCLFYLPYVHFLDTIIRITSLPTKDVSLSSLPPTIKVIFSCPVSLERMYLLTSAPLNLTIKSGTPLLLWSPISDGAARSTTTVLSRVTVETSISLTL